MDVCLHFRQSWQLPVTQILVTTVLQNPCLVDGRVFTPTDCSIRFVTLHCSDPPRGFKGEITFPLSSVLYLAENSHYKLMDGTSSWPEGSSPRKTAVLELRWDTEDVLTLGTPGSVQFIRSGPSNGQSSLQGGAASKPVGGSEQSHTQKLTHTSDKPNDLFLQ